jgi:hypothetical protein
MRFSLLHATARTPTGWIPAYDAWCSNANDRSNIEYVLSVHLSDKPSEWPGTWEPEVTAYLRLYSGRRCSVEGWNQAAYVSTGEVLIQVADDFYPPRNWDLMLDEVIGDRTDAFAVHVGTGSARDVEPLMSHVIMSRALYQGLGYLLYPGYDGMYSDDDITALVYGRGLVISALHLPFEHRHFTFGKSEQDTVYQYQNRAEGYQAGLETFERRRREGAFHV